MHSFADLLTSNMLLYLVFISAVVRGLNAKSSTIGREFVFGILDMGEACAQCHFKDNTVTLDVTNVSPQDAHVRLRIPFLHIDTYYNISTGQQQNINISNTIQASGTFKNSRGIQITSDNDVSVLVTNSLMSNNTDISMDVYNVLPVSSISNQYNVLSHKAGYMQSDIGSAFLVTALDSHTKLTIKINGSRHNEILNALDVYQYVCPNYCDLTGTVLEADKNITVIAGSTFSSITNEGKDYLSSEMIPSSAWSTSYIVPPLLPNSGFLLKLTSTVHLRVTLANSTSSFVSHGELHEMEFENLPVIVTSNAPIALAQYGVFDRHNANATGDLFMTVVPGIQQYINNYMFTVPHAFYGNTQHYIAIVAPKQEKNNVMLDNQSVQSRNISSGDITEHSVPHPFDNYTVLTFQTTEGFHHFWHPKSNVVFGVLVYGLGDSLGYGFFAGYDFEGKESSFDDMSSPTASFSQRVTSSTVHTTTHSKTHESTTESSSQKVTSSTMQITMSNRTQGQLCYQCMDLIHPYLCDTLEKCSSNEICYLESYTVSGQRKYRSGCMDAHVCEHKKTVIPSALCYECCTDNFCNNNGCGDLGIPDRSARGPICFHCDYASSPDECLKVEPCQSHEACKIEKYTWFGGNFHYKMGCDYFPCNTSESSNSVHTSHVVKRATLLCNQCCSDDYCNRNCTKASGIGTGAPIIG